MSQKRQLLRIIMVFLASSLLISGCWNSLEIDRTIIAIGTGFSTSDKGLRITVEVMKPVMSDQTGHDVDNLILEEVGPTFLDIGRRLIRQGKRRLNFSHNRVWIIHKKIARDDIMTPLEVLKRDEMFRLNSYMFITPDDPKDILTTNTLVEKLSSIELAASMELTQFTSEYEAVTLEQFYNTMSGPVDATVIPIIETRKPNKLVTEITGMALIKGKRMIGEIDPIESRGLLYLRNEANGGVLTSKIMGEPVSIEIVSSKAKMVPKFKDDDFHIDISLKLRGLLGDIPADLTTNTQTIERIEQSIENDLLELIERVMHKLQKEYKADVIRVGLFTYRKYPKKWHEIEDRWDDIFSKAIIHVGVDVQILHEGLSIRSRGTILKKPKFNPFMPSRS